MKKPSTHPPKKSVKNLATKSNLSRIAQYDPYIKEVRTKVIRIMLFFGVGAALGGVYYQKILSGFMTIFKLDGINLVLTSPYQFIDLSIKTGIGVGVIFAVPIFIYYFSQFIKPALKPEEFSMLIKMLPFSILLFVGGFSFGVWVVQFVIELFSQTASNFQIGNIWDLSDFFTEILITGFSLGIVFQLPIIISSLIRLKFVPKQFFVKQRKVFFASILIFAAILPTTDLASLFLLTTIPLLLFEVTLLLN